MTNPWGVLFFTATGVLILGVAWRGWQAGELPAGSKGLKLYRPNRDDQPVAYWFFLLLYLAFGAALLIRGLTLLFSGAVALG